MFLTDVSTNLFRGNVYASIIRLGLIFKISIETKLYTEGYYYNVSAYLNDKIYGSDLFFQLASRFEINIENDKCKQMCKFTTCNV